MKKRKRAASETSDRAWEGYEMQAPFVPWPEDAEPSRVVDGPAPRQARDALYPEEGGPMTVAALYVDPRGCYAGIEGVEVWDEARDARRYAGPWPVVAHPPCSTWCRLASVNKARYGHPVGSDGGCFEAALAAVREFGGVLEHPAFSAAWGRFGLQPPPTSGGWTVADWQGGWTCYVEQRAYGHRARKGTWLYAVGVELPSLPWGRREPGEALVSWCRNYTSDDDDRPRIGKQAAAATPKPFRDLLLDMARSAVQPSHT